MSKNRSPARPPTEEPVQKTDRIAILGGGGFIGRALVRELQNAGYSRLSVLGRSPVQKLAAGVEYRSGVDITRPETLAEALDDASVVINLAGLVSFARRDRHRLQDVNVHGAQHLLGACSALPKLKRFVHLSSTAALGYADHRIDEAHDFPWDQHLHLHYSRSKYLANAALDASRVPTNIVFPPMVLGPGDTTTTARIFEYVRGKKRLVVPPGTNSFIDVRDLAHALRLVLEQAEAKENFIAASEAVRFRELFATAAELVGRQPRIVELPKLLHRPLHALAWLGESVLRSLHAETVFLGFTRRIHNADKIRSLGWQPQYGLTETLQAYLAEA